MINELQKILDEVYVQKMYLDSIIESTNNETYKDKLKEITFLMSTEPTTYNIEQVINWVKENNFKEAWLEVV